MFYKIQDQHILLHVYAKPHAKRSALVKITAENLHIAIHAKPHEGEANKALILFIAKWLSIPKSAICIVRGETSKHKEVLIPFQKHVIDRLQTTDL